MYDEDIVIKIKKLKKDGKSYNEISKMLDIAKSSVWWILNKRKRGNHGKPGPKCKINRRLSTRIKRYVEKMNNNGSKVDCNKVKNELQLDIGRRTINNWFIKHGFKYKSHAQKFMLTNKHKNMRIEVVSEWLKEKIEWENCVFTDEKCWSLDGPDNW